MNNVKQSHSIDLAKTSSSSANSNRETSSVASLAMPFLNTTTSSITQGLHHPIYTHPPIAVSQVFIFIHLLVILNCNFKFKFLSLGE